MGLTSFCVHSLVEGRAVAPDSVTYASYQACLKSFSLPLLSVPPGNSRTKLTQQDIHQLSHAKSLDTHLPKPLLLRRRTEWYIFLLHLSMSHSCQKVYRRKQDMVGKGNWNWPLTNLFQASSISGPGGPTYLGWWGLSGMYSCPSSLKPGLPENLTCSISIDDLASARQC